MPEVGDGRPAGCKPAAPVHPQSDSGLRLAFPASGKSLSASGIRSAPPLRKAGARFESRRKHRCFPLWQRRPTQPAADARVETRRPAAAHRHTVLTVTTHTRLGRNKGQRGYFGSRGRGVPPTARAHARGRKPPPQTARSRAPALADPSASITAAPKPWHATPPVRIDVR
jgi:hypothetical protein